MSREVHIGPDGIYISGDRVTPYSRIPLEGALQMDEYLETMQIQLDEALLVVRGKADGKAVEFMVGNLKTEGTRNAIVLLHHVEREHLRFDNRSYLGYEQDEWRIRIDCELAPNEDGHTFTVREER